MQRDAENHTLLHFSLTSGLAERAAPEVHIGTNAVQDAVITVNLHMQKKLQALVYGQSRKYLLHPE